MVNFHFLAIVIQLIILQGSTQNLFDDSFRNKCASSLFCKSRKISASAEPACYCDSECSMYNDCCFDARFRGRGPIYNSSCLQFSGVNMIDKCSINWIGSNVIKNRCENSNDMGDPFGMAPLTSINQRKTYRNNFCSVCNFNDDESMSWLIGVSCAGVQKPNVQGMIYRRDLNEWGFCTHKADGTIEYNKCNFIFRAPNQISEITRKCKYAQIQDCSTDWPDDSIRSMCQSYVGVVYVRGTSFKNYHCALCNSVNVNDINCFPPPGVSINFNLLLDINENGGSIVGREDICQDGEVWDPFSKKCRTKVCGLPGFVMRNGKCVSV